MPDLSSTCTSPLGERYANATGFAEPAILFPLAPTQVPTWSPDDLQFFLHGSMSTEVAPENVLLFDAATGARIGHQAH